MLLAPWDLTASNVYCIGRNYAGHARELNNPIPERPLVFQKPTSSLVAQGGAIILPPESQDVHHEVEVVVAIGREGRRIDPDAALDHVLGYAVGIDVTARDIQREAKAKGHPWTVAKGFDTFAPLGAFVDASVVPDPQNLDVLLEINGAARQRGNTSQMLFPIPQLIAYLSTIVTLKRGDLIYTGTPEGVGALQAGDVLHASLGDGLAMLDVRVERL